MNKLIKGIENIGFLLGCFICLLTLMMMCAEPITWDEDGLYDFEHLWDKGNSGWYVMWTWVWSVVTLIGLIVVRSFIKKKITK